jgi:glycolate oxidase FAD binding subunit
MSAPAPADADGIVAAIAAAAEAGTPLAIAGNGGKSGLLRPVQAAKTLSTGGLTGISLYSPQELILTAGAGTAVADIAAATAAKGQHIISEPPDLSAFYGTAVAPTLGGMVGANLSGPRRVMWGATRDHVMGLAAINGRAERIHSGGRVLKNVTGLDLCKLLTGSYGTLAVITEITLKVLPAPERRGTLLLRGLDPARAVAALSRALGSPYAVSGAAHLPAAQAARVSALSWAGSSVTLARIEDFAPAVAYRTERLRAELAEFGQAELLDDGASTAAWAAIRDLAPMVGRDGAVWRISVRPSAGPAAAAAVEAAFGAEWFMDWGGGLLWVAGPATPEAHQAVMRAAGQGNFTLMRAPEPLRAAVPVIPPAPAPLAAIAARVKASFDPKGILNPGRMEAGQ